MTLRDQLTKCFYCNIEIVDREGDTVRVVRVQDGSEDFTHILGSYLDEEVHFISASLLKLDTLELYLK